MSSLLTFISPSRALLNGGVFDVDGGAWSLAQIGWVRTSMTSRSCRGKGSASPAKTSKCTGFVHWGLLFGGFEGWVFLLRGTFQASAASREAARACASGVAVVGQPAGWRSVMLARRHPFRVVVEGGIVSWSWPSPAGKQRGVSMLISSRCFQAVGGQSWGRSRRPGARHFGQGDQRGFGGLQPFGASQSRLKQDGGSGLA